MKTFVLSLLAGCLIGVIYGLLKVRSPAPPVVALVGLLGILMGEHLVGFAKSHFFSDKDIKQSHSVTIKESKNNNHASEK